MPHAWRRHCVCVCVCVCVVGDLVAMTPLTTLSEATRVVASIQAKRQARKTDGHHPDVETVIGDPSRSPRSGALDCGHVIVAIVSAMIPGARFTKYLTTVLRLSYDNAKVTIDL